MTSSTNTLEKNTTEQGLSATRPTRWLILCALLVAVELGAFVRFVLLSSGDFPLNDGGLFYVMAQDIRHAGYMLPTVSSYNGTNMPFAYPPLGFYLAALLSNGCPLIGVVRFLPAIINLLTIPAFYLLARTILKSEWQAVIATFAFALLPRAFKFLIMGGGLSRSPGFLFAILLMQQAYLLYTTRDRRYVIPTMILGALTVLSHPEMTLYGGWSCLLFLLFYGRNRTSLIHTLIVCVGVVLLTSIWWLPVISRFGLAPFLAAYATGEQSWAISIGLLFSGVGFVEQSLLGVIALFGAVRGVAHGKYLLPVWLVSIFVIAPRSAQTFAVIVVALLIGVTVSEVLLPALRPSEKQIRSRVQRRNLNIALTLFGFMFIVYSVFTAISTSIPVLSKDERTAMQWVADNTPDNSQFVLVTGYHWYEDAVSEWFPVLSSRYSLATVQGYEWFPQSEFQRRQKSHEQLQQCADQTVSCLEQWSKESNTPLTYIYVSQTKNANSPLQASLAASPDYQQVYIGSGAVIFKKR